MLVAPAANAAKYPTVSSVKPLSAGVGNTLTIRGKNFRPGNGKSTVVFRSTRNGRTIFVKAATATKTRITVVVPAKLMPFMNTSAGAARPTRFQIRVVGRRLGKKYTARSRSPLLGPVSRTGGSPGGSSNSDGDCDADGVKNSADGDDDNDQLSDGLEISLRLDPCLADTDGDGVTDGYEYKSALDYNNGVGGLSLPYPGKRPYPNPLDDDANIDHDGDGLTLYEEFSAWSYTGRPATLSYSAGTQWTGGKISSAFAMALGSGSFDLNGDGTISDNEKDVDNDGLDNYAETHGPMSGPAWWTAVYGTPSNNECGVGEKAYPLSQFSGTSFVDADVDGDGVLDGADDIDRDGYSNAFEAYRPGVFNHFTAGTPSGSWCTTYVSVGHPGGSDNRARVQPFNPCKPTYSDYCHPYSAVPVGYYAGDDWESPVHSNGP